MSKIKGLYHHYYHEREMAFRDYCTGSNSLKESQESLKSKLNADDYTTVKEMLNNLVSEIEEKSFAAGAKYTASLGMELFTE